MKILLVEDSAEKAGAIKHVLASVAELKLATITDAADGVSARRVLADEVFDLLILDIALPRRPHEVAAPDEGLLLLEEVISHPQRFRIPAHVIGITAYPDIYTRALDLFSSRLLTLIFYDHSSLEWEDRLRARALHIRNALQAVNEVQVEYRSDLAILCALDSPELTQVLRIPWGWQQAHIAHDHTIYWRGAFSASGQPGLVHAATTARMGMPAAAVLATKVIHTFRPRFLAMVGITAGIRGRVELGDIVIADPCWDWGSGKWILHGGVPRFQAAPHQLRLSGYIREKARLFSRATPALARIRDEWPGEKPPAALSLRIGPMASGASVLADGRTAETILTQHRELLAIEMEAYGAFAAGEECSEPRPDTFALKSVVDFADGVKEDRYQAYGAFVSARVLKEFAENHLF